MYAIQIKNRAKILRKSGKGIYDIARILGLNPTTISYWCKDIELSELLIKKIKYTGMKKARAGMLLYTEKQRKTRIKRILREKEEGAMSIGNLSQRDIFMLGLGLYWGDGYKENNGELGFTNSNVRVMRFYLRWLELQGVIKKDLIFRLTINEIFKSQEKRLKKLWVRSLKVSAEQFSATTFIQTKLKKAIVARKNTYTGVLRVKVRQGGMLKNKILGALEYASA